MRANESLPRGLAGGIKNGLERVLAKLREFIAIAFSMAAAGCYHRRMGRPRTVDGVTYRACLDCGMKRPFDPEAWRAYGTFLYGLPQGRPARAAGAPAFGQALRRAA